MLILLLVCVVVSAAEVEFGAEGQKTVSEIHQKLLQFNNITTCLGLHDELSKIATTGKSLSDAVSHDMTNTEKGDKNLMLITKDNYEQHQDSLHEILKQCVEEEGHTKNRFKFKTWVLGSGVVLLISLVSMTGALIIPFMNAKVYHYVLSFMVSLAVGSLSGSSIFHLIPQAFDLVNEESSHAFLSKGATVLAGIYLFFITERLLKSIMRWRKTVMSAAVMLMLVFKKKRHFAKKRKGQYEQQEKGQGVPPICSVKAREYHYEYSLREPPHIVNSTCTTPSSLTTTNSSVDVGIVADGNDSNGVLVPISETDADTEKGPRDTDEELKANNKLYKALDEHGDVHKNNSSGTQIVSHCSHGHQVDRSRPIATVAWMVIFGDGIHNFIDGLAIGAAFVTSSATGVSTSVAVICEELPHELGDFAILLNAGMTWRQALFYNFLSALSCFIGMAMGILLGEMAEASQWIFGLAGGMFLYISLVDMMPEMAAAATTTPRGENEESSADDCGPKYGQLANADSCGVKFSKSSNSSHHDDDESSSEGSPSCKMLMLQSLGLFIGWFLMFIFAKYGTEITF